MKTGRKRKVGPRYKCGKLKPLRDPGNERVRAHRDLFLRHGQVKPGDDLDCALGQAHAAGLLEGMRIDGRVLMEYGREYHRLHRHVYGGRVRTTAFERIDRSAPSLVARRSDHHLREWEGIVARLSRDEQRCLREVCIEHGEGWDLPLFLQRMINEWKVKALPSLDGTLVLPRPGDRQSLDHLRSALLALAEGRSPRRT